MNRIVGCMLAILLGIAIAIVSIFPADAAYKRTYTRPELLKAVEACYYEYGSSMLQQGFEARYQAFLRTMLHSILNRAETLNPYFRSDWGGPELRKVIEKNRQYSYRLYPHGVPSEMSSNPWSLLDQLLGGLPLLTPLFSSQTAEPLLPGEIVVDGKVVVKDLWERCVKVTYDVYVRRLVPKGPLAEADTYWHKCLLKDFRPANKAACGKLKLAEGENLCWHTMEQVILPGQLPVHRLEKHIYSRRVNPKEQRERLEAPLPPECAGHEEYVEQKIFTAWRYWLPIQEAALADLQKAEETYITLLEEQQKEKKKPEAKEPAKKKKKHIKSSKKGKKEGKKPKKSPKSSKKKSGKKRR